MSEAEEFDLIKTATDCVYPLPIDGGGTKKGKEEAEMEAEVLLESSMEALHDLLRELLNKDLTTDGLDAIFKVSNSGLLPLKDLSCYLVYIGLLIMKYCIQGKFHPHFISTSFTCFKTEFKTESPFSDKNSFCDKSNYGT